MMISKLSKILAPMLLSILLLVTSCASKEPSRYQGAQQESTKRGATPAISKNATQGSNFNKFFPKSGGGYQAVPAQEKKGFAEYKLKQNGKDVAVMSIADTTSNPTAAQKYQNSSKKIAGYPAIDQGTNITGLLVGRYQVKVQSRNPSFTKSDREAWLQKFDLGGLSRVRGG